MTTIPAPNVAPSEEWPDADFDLPEGQPINAKVEEEEEDWDLDMDLGKIRGAKLSFGSGMDGDGPQSKVFNVIRPRPPSLDDLDDDDDDEGVSTIKVAVLPKLPPKVMQTSIDEDDFEDAFALPSDMTRLSLAPLSLHHQSSKSSLEWGSGDKDQTSSSQSSDAYSSLGFADTSPSSNSTSASSHEADTDDDCDDDADLDGLVIPTDLFESNHGSRQLTKILALKKAAIMANTRVKDSSPDPEDDFEMGLVIDDDVDLSPSRLLQNVHSSKARTNLRSNSMPAHRPATGLRPPSRLKSDRAKSPVNPPVSSSRQLNNLRLSPSPPLRPPTRSQTFQSLSATPTGPTSFLAPKPGSLRGQKSHTGLKPPSPATRTLARKASLSSLLESSQTQASGSGSSAAGSSKARYEEPTAASRAKSHKNSMSRLSTRDYIVPPTRPSTPSSNTAALRLTMPTQSRLKSRPPLSSVWSGAPASPAFPSPTFRTASPIPSSRPPSSLSRSSLRTPSIPTAHATRQMKRPKRQRTYGDGTELDEIEDLPTDRDKESRFRVLPKLHGNRVPGGSYSSKAGEKGTLRRKGKRDISSTGSIEAAGLFNISNAQKRLAGSHSSNGPSPTKKKKLSSPNAPSHRKKPTLIRNLGGVGAPKVIGDMRWNPQTLRWEGNEGVLREFDAVVTSTRPALITHLTGSSLGSPVGSFASGARRVGNMIFDPSRMCWISTLPPEEDEPDVFANLADDEDEDGCEGRGGTIRASLQSTSTADSSSSNQSQGSSTLVGTTASPARSHTSMTSESDSDRGSRASTVYNIDETFIQSCRHAEERHRTEMKGWRSALVRQDVFSEPDRSYLYDIRALATRKY